MVTRRSVASVVAMANKTIIKTICKRQTTVETSTYGAELVTARMATDLAIELRYKFWMLGFEIDGPTIMFGDNMSVVLNTTVP